MEESPISVCFSYFISALYLQFSTCSSLLKSNFLLIFYPITVLPLGRVTVTATTGDRAAVCGPAAAAALALIIFFSGGTKPIYLCILSIIYLDFPL